MAKLSGKIAVVTGGTGALGQNVTKRLLMEGATVIATHTGRSDTESSAIIDHQVQNLSYDVLDVTNERSVGTFYDQLLSKHGRIDILCNLVGGIRQKKFIEDISFEEWNEMFRVNLDSCFLMTRNAVRSMKLNSFGRIINITAMPAILPEPKRGGYGVAKAGVITLTKTVAEEVKGFGDITVNAIAPSTILTEANKQWGTEEEIKKWVTPGQIAEMIIVLCSDSGAAINGHIIQMYGKV
ncbi:MAG: SDR family NAD(P)-dependent oxidoreductase [Bacteriovoracaceae bacterium]